MEHLSQEKRVLEMVERARQLWVPAGTCILDVEICGTVYRCTKVWFLLLFKGCLSKRGGVKEGAGQNSLSVR